MIWPYPLPLLKAVMFLVHAFVFRNFKQSPFLLEFEQNRVTHLKSLTLNKK